MWTVKKVNCHFVKGVDKYSMWHRTIVPLLMGWGVLMFFSCSKHESGEVDRLNEVSYAWHYRNLDSTLHYARRAYDLSEHYRAGRAEALNNMAFVSIAHMDYPKAWHQLTEALKTTDNQVERLIAQIQLMRLCQRQSRNKDFYVHHQQAVNIFRRIDEEQGSLGEHLRERMVYARSEFSIVSSTYFYYVGHEQQSSEALLSIDPYGEIERDTAQTLNFLYNIGSGGIIRHGTKAEVRQTEFDYLLRCYLMSLHGGYPYWEANSLQAISEHMQDAVSRRQLIRDNMPAMKYINVDQMPDSLLAGNLAQRSLDIFTRYGDVYQTAGAYRTLAECYWAIKDYRSALICLNNALDKDTLINRAPDLVASIREQLSLAYSAIDDKQQSDYNRNIYLDIQEYTRQDRQQEARIEQLQNSSTQLNRLMIAVSIMIVLVVLSLFVFDRMRRRSDKKFSLAYLMKPLQEWKQKNDKQLHESAERYEEIIEQQQMARLHLFDNKKRYLEQRAKISLVNSIMPLIDRMVNEVQRLTTTRESEDIRKRRYAYVSELTEQINNYNDTLTRWIQMRQGELNLHIESFPLRELFDTVGRSRMSFQLKDLQLQVIPTKDVVKADKILTLFMINTMADNARKFTPSGGRVTISSQSTSTYVEISVTDTGVGLSQEQAEHIFDHKPIMDSIAQRPVGTEHSHGFGLMNCKGIIDKYRKISSLFHVCEIGVESPLTDGHGSRFFFRLPKGVTRVLMVVLFLCSTLPSVAFRSKTAQSLSRASIDLKGDWRDFDLQQAARYADMAWNCNVHGEYRSTLLNADTCRMYLNAFYQRHVSRGHRQYLMSIGSNDEVLPAELVWFRQRVPTNYQLILYMRNECVIAALALHDWNLYRYNNNAYIKLMRESSADYTLDNYVEVMQRAESSKNVATILLLLLLIMIFPAYYLIYYRHRLYYRFCIDRVGGINNVLLSDERAEEKLALIDKIWKKDEAAFGSDPQITDLSNLVDNIRVTLRQSVAMRQKQETSIELAADELRREKYEGDVLHVRNSVLDNCLSTLKHETMYYPSRIRQLIDGTDAHLHAIRDLLSYYKELYTLLSMQAMRQVEGTVHIDADMIRYLFDILIKLGGYSGSIAAESLGHGYVKLCIPMPRLHLSNVQCEQLFTPSTSDIQFLLCRQIVRDMGEATNARGCGIEAKQDEQGAITMDVIVTESVVNIIKNKDITGLIGILSDASPKDSLLLSHPR